jgi:hypothetical protein
MNARENGRRRAWQAWGRSGAAVGLAIGTLVLASPWRPADAAASGTYSGVADARLLAVGLNLSPPLIFPQLVDAGSSVAQAELSSLGTSTAFASDPYPSGSVVAAPGLVAGLTGGATSGLVPDYPLITSSAFPVQPDGRVQAGPIDLQAHSERASTRASSRNGLDVAEASVTADGDLGEVTVRAQASAAAVNISSLLSVDGVRSSATAKAGPDGKVQLSSSFDVVALTIAGQRVPIIDDLITGEGGLLSAAPSILGALLGPLAEQGTTVEILPSTRTSDSITSAGLRIRTRQPVPPDLASGIEFVTFDITIGQVSARVDNLALALPGTSPADVGSGIGSGVGIGPPADGGALAIPSAPVTPAVPATGTHPATSIDGGTRLIADISVSSIYPVLLAAGLVLVAVVNLVRKLGVQQP